jgi:hypothetical protein
MRRAVIVAAILIAAHGAAAAFASIPLAFAPSAHFRLRVTRGNPRALSAQPSGTRRPSLRAMTCPTRTVATNNARPHAPIPGLHAPIPALMFILYYTLCSFLLFYTLWPPLPVARTALSEEVCRCFAEHGAFRACRAGLTFRRHLCRGNVSEDVVQVCQRKVGRARVLLGR